MVILLASAEDVLPQVSSDQTGMIHYYKFDGDSTDWLGRSNGTDYNVTYVTGNLSEAASINASGTSYIRYTGGNNILFNGSGTISFFSRANDCTQNTGNYNTNVLLSLNNGSGAYGSATSYGMWIVQEGGFQRLYIANGSGNARLTSDTNICKLLNNTWVFQTYTFSYSSADCILTRSYYINGVLNLTNSSVICDMSKGRISDLRIGRDSGSVYYHNGTFDEMMFMNRSMSVDEILNMYNNYKNSYRPIDVLSNDSCEYSGSGDWVVTDNCNWTVSTNILGNLYLKTGIITNLNAVFNLNHNKILIDSGVRLQVNTGGGIR